jgi:acyl carrier protein
MQENPLLTRILESVETQEAHGLGNDLRLKIASASPDELAGLLLQAVRGAVASVLRVKPETLRDDQPLTDLGLDSLMGVEIENSIETSIGVSLPPASLLRVRTIGHIVGLLTDHMGARRGNTPVASVKSDSTPGQSTAEAVDLDALSDEEMDRLVDDLAEPVGNANPPR